VGGDSVESPQAEDPNLRFANNHFAGYAPATVESFRRLWNESTKGDRAHDSKAKTGRLFD
jgi:hypothetical protein